jgi:hypothetical protein
LKNGEWASREGGTWVFHRRHPQTSTVYQGFIVVREFAGADPQRPEAWEAHVGLRTEHFNDLEEAKAWVECGIAVVFAKMAALEKDKVG